jgi:hypothetical protein
LRRLSDKSTKFTTTWTKPSRARGGTIYSVGLFAWEKLGMREFARNVLVLLDMYTAGLVLIAAKCCPPLVAKWEADVVGAWTQAADMFQRYGSKYGRARRCLKILKALRDQVDSTWRQHSDAAAAAAAAAATAYTAANSGPRSSTDIRDGRLTGFLDQADNMESQPCPATAPTYSPPNFSFLDEAFAGAAAGAGIIDGFSHLEVLQQYPMLDASLGISWEAAASEDVSYAGI